MPLMAVVACLFSQSAFAIIGGDPNGVPMDSPSLRIDPNTPSSPWAGVGSLTVGDKSFTATLIDERHVITAAHVVGNSSPSDITFNINADGDFSQRIVASAVHVNPNYHGFHPGLDGLVHGDLAIVELSQAVPKAIPVYPIYQSELYQGAVLNFVGYGGAGDGIVGDLPGSSPHTKRLGENVADYFVPGSSGKPELFMFDFDGPTLSSNHMGGGTLGNNVEATFASGDSGSPVFLNDDGHWYLAGVGTFVTRFKGSPDKNSLFGTGGGGIILSYYSGWITQTTSILPEPSPMALWMPGVALIGLIVSLQSKRAARHVFMKS
jgi:secreted trypsin-like serine protease